MPRAVGNRQSPEMAPTNPSRKSGGVFGKIALAALLVVTLPKVAEAGGEALFGGVDVEFTADEHLTDKYPTIADARALTEAERQELFAEYSPDAPSALDFEDMPALSIDYKVSEIPVPMRSALSILTYEGDAFSQGALIDTYSGYVGHLSIMDINGELVAVGINHVLDAAPKASRYYVDVPRVGHIPLRNAQDFETADIVPDSPTHLDSGETRSDPPVVVALPYKSQLFLRMMEDAGFFEPIKTTKKDLKAGETVYVFSQLSGQMLPLIVNGQKNASVRTTDDLIDIKGQYSAETPQAMQQEVKSYPELDDGIIDPIFDQAAFNRLICAGFSGAPVFTIDAQNNFAAVGLMSSVTVQYHDNTGRHCGFRANIEPL